MFYGRIPGASKILLVRALRSIAGELSVEEASDAVVDLFLTDISGFQVITDLRSLQPHIPILLITAHGSPQVFDEAKRLGAIGALAKPFPPAEILKLIDSHLHGPTPDSP